MARKAARRGSATLNTTAESIGAALGRVAAKLDAWKQQRAEIAAEMQKLMRSALGDLDGAAGKSAKPGAAARKGGRPKGYKMSEATKRKLRAAWKRRKAAATTKPTQS
jgi:hypothetical protein